jgi:hypothetical protein
MRSTDMSTGFSQKIALPCLRAGLDQIEMRVGRRADDDGVDVIAGDDGLALITFGAGLFGQRLAASGKASATAATRAPATRRCCRHEPGRCVRSPEFRY